LIATARIDAGYPQASGAAGMIRMAAQPHNHNTGLFTKVIYVCGFAAGGG
jgi:hypothetical protein